MGVFFGIAYFLVGLLQIFAIADGAQYAFGLGNVLSFILAMVLTYIPLVGAAFGVYGAHTAWDWSLWLSLALFFWYVPVWLAATLADAVLSRR